MSSDSSELLQMQKVEIATEFAQGPVPISLIAASLSPSETRWAASTADGKMAIDAPHSNPFQSQ